jgi:hypothetical protein
MVLAVSVNSYLLLTNYLQRLRNYFLNREEGQATAEYLLVLLMAAVIVFVVTKMFASKGSHNPVSTLVGNLVDGLVGSAGKIIKSFLWT